MTFCNSRFNKYYSKFYSFRGYFSFVRPYVLGGEKVVKIVFQYYVLEWFFGTPQVPRELTFLELTSLIYSEGKEWIEKFGRTEVKGFSEAHLEVTLKWPWSWVSRLFKGQRGFLTWVPHFWPQSWKERKILRSHAIFEIFFQQLGL